MSDHNEEKSWDERESETYPSWSLYLTAKSITKEAWQRAWAAANEEVKSDPDRFKQEVEKQTKIVWNEAEQWLRAEYPAIDIGTDLRTFVCDLEDAREEENAKDAEPLDVLSDDTTSEAEPDITEPSVEELNSWLESTQETVITDVIEDAVTNGRFKEAVELITKELESDPDSDWLLERLSAAYLMGDPVLLEKSVAISNKILEKEPTNYLSRWNLAIAQERLGQYRIAAENFHAIAKLSVNDISKNYGCTKEWATSLLIDSYFPLARCLWKLKQNKTAVAWMNRYLESRNDTTDYWGTSDIAELAVEMFEDKQQLKCVFEKLL